MGTDGPGTSVSLAGDCLISATHFGLIYSVCVKSGFSASEVMLFGEDDCERM